MTAHPTCRAVAKGLAIIGMAAFGLLVALPAAPSSGEVVAVFPPWWNAVRAFAAAADAGSVVRLGPVGFIALVRPDGNRGRETLWRSGAWMLLDPRGLAGCGPSSRLGSTT